MQPIYIIEKLNYLIKNFNQTIKEKIKMSKFTITGNMEQTFLYEITAAKKYHFELDHIIDSSFWKGRGIHVIGEKDQCVIHTKTNLVFRKDGTIIGMIDKNFDITSVNALPHCVLEWIRFQDLKTNIEEITIEV